MHFRNSDELCKYVSERSGGVVVLSFSNGKDSLATWLVLRRYFKRVIPFHLYRFPNISFVEKSLAYYEEFFDTHIYRLPHPALYRMLNALVFQAPENCHIIEEFGLPDFDFDYLHQVMFEDFDLDETVYVAQGITSSDNMQRRISIKQHGALNATRRTFYPIYDYKKEDLVREIVQSGVKLPIDYRLFGRSFDGVNFQFLEPVKEHYPEDYARMLHLFPLAELDVLRMQYRRDYYARQEKEKRKS